MSESYAITAPTAAGATATPVKRSVITPLVQLNQGVAVSVNVASPGVTDHKGDTDHDMGPSSTVFGLALGVTIRITVGGVEEDVTSAIWQSPTSISFNFDIYPGTEILVDSLL